MSDNPFWQVTLARSSDLVGIGTLSYAFSFNPIFNRPGSFSMTMPLDDEIAYRVAKHSTCVVCERNGEAKWSGSITTVARDAAANTLTLSALGWLDELNHRFVRPAEEAALTFSSVIGGSIVQTLIGTVNAQTDTNSIVRPTHLGFFSHSDTQARTRSYKRGQSYGQAITELVDVENGLDIRVDPKTRRISTYPPTAFVDRRGVVFGFGMEPHNLANASQNDDGANTANRVSAVGSNGVIVPADDPDAIASAGVMRESWLSLSNIVDVDIIGAYANAELVYFRYGQVTYELTPLSYGDIPRLYDDYELGDKAYLSIDRGALQVDNQAIRIFGATINVDAQGNETISSIITAPQ